MTRKSILSSVSAIAVATFVSVSASGDALAQGAEDVRIAQERTNLQEQYDNLKDRQNRMNDARKEYERQLEEAVDNGDDKRAAEVRVLLTEIMNLQEAIHTQSMGIAEALNEHDKPRMEAEDKIRQDISQEISDRTAEEIAEQIEWDGDLQEVKEWVTWVTRWVSIGGEMQYETSRGTRLGDMALAISNARLAVIDEMLEDADPNSYEHKVLTNKKELNTIQRDSAEEFLAANARLTTIGYTLDVILVASGAVVVNVGKKVIASAVSRAFGKAAGNKAVVVLEKSVTEVGTQIVGRTTSNTATKGAAAAGDTLPTLVANGGDTTLIGGAANAGDTLVMNGADAFADTVMQEAFDVGAGGAQNAHIVFQQFFEQFLRLRNIDPCTASQQVLQRNWDQFMKKHGLSLFKRLADSVAGGADDLLIKFADMTPSQISALAKQEIAGARGLAHEMAQYGAGAQTRAIRDYWRAIYSELAERAETEVADQVAEAMGGQRAVDYLNALRQGADNVLEPPIPDMGVYPRGAQNAPMPGWNTPHTPTPASTSGSGAGGQTTMFDNPFSGGASNADPNGLTTLFSAAPVFLGLGLCGEASAAETAMGADAATNEAFLNNVAIARNNQPVYGGAAQPNPYLGGQFPYDTPSRYGYPADVGQSLVYEAQHGIAQRQHELAEYEERYPSNNGGTGYGVSDNIVPVTNTGGKTDTRYGTTDNLPNVVTRGGNEPGYNTGRTCGGSALPYPVGLGGNRNTCGGSAPNPVKTTNSSYGSSDNLPKVATQGGGEPGYNTGRTCGGSALSYQMEYGGYGNGITCGGSAPNPIKTTTSYGGTNTRAAQPHAASNAGNAKTANANPGGQPANYNFHSAYNIPAGELIRTAPPTKALPGNPYQRANGSVVTPRDAFLSYSTGADSDLDPLRKKNGTLKPNLATQNGQTIRRQSQPSTAPVMLNAPKVAPQYLSGTYAMPASQAQQARQVQQAQQAQQYRQPNAYQSSNTLPQNYQRPVFAPGNPSSINKTSTNNPVILTPVPQALDGSGPVDPKAPQVQPQNNASFVVNTGK